MKLVGTRPYFAEVENAKATDMREFFYHETYPTSSS